MMKNYRGASRKSAALPSFFSLPLASLDPRLTVQVDSSPAKRPSDPLDAGSIKKKRTAQDKGETDLDEDLTEFGFAPGRCVTERRTARDKAKPELEANLTDYGIIPTRDDLLRLAASPKGR